MQTILSNSAPRLWLQILTVVILTIGVYQYAPQGQFMNIDDGSLVYKNTKIQEMNTYNFKEIFSTYDPELYIPFTLLSYMAEYHFFGENPAVFHVTNVVLHLLNVLLVLGIARYLSNKWIVLFLTAIVFAIHPINTEAVMWISSRKDLLSAFFFLGSILLYCRHRVHGDRLSLYSSVLLCIFALFSKIIAVSLPLVLLIIDDVLPANDTKFSALKHWLYRIPALIFLAVGMIGKMLSVFVLPYFDAALLACKGVYFSLLKILFPLHLSMIYEQVSPIHILRPDFLLPICVLFLLVIVLFASRRFGKTFSFGIMWFGCTLLPNLGNAVKGMNNIYFASDRYVYLPSIGIFFLMAVGIVWIWERSHTLQKYVLQICTVLIIGAYAGAAHQYSILWLTPKGYMTHIVELYPQSALAQMLLGLAHVQEEDNAAAAPYFRESIRLKPHWVHTKAHLALALMKTGDIDSGITLLEEVRPETLLTYPNVYLAYGYMLNNDDRKAEILLSSAHAADPTDAKALQLLGILEERLGNNAQAKIYLQQSLDVDPSSVQAKAALAAVMRRQ